MPCVSAFHPAPIAPEIVPGGSRPLARTRHGAGVSSSGRISRRPDPAADHADEGRPMSRSGIAEEAAEEVRATPRGPCRGPAPRLAGPRGEPGAAHARPPAGRQPGLHDRPGVRGHPPALVARPEGDGRVVPGGDVVLARLRAAPGDRRVRLHVRRPVHRGRPAGAGRAGRLAGDPLRRRGRARVPAHGPGRPVPDRPRRAHPGLARCSSRPTCAASASRPCRCWSWPRSTGSSPGGGRPGPCSGSRRPGRR